MSPNHPSTNTVVPNEDGTYEAVVHCQFCGFVALTRSNYFDQMAQPDSFWKCPLCLCSASWSDTNYDNWYANNAPKQCPNCGGSGSVTCRKCNGTGFTGNDICCGGIDDCPVCSGSGEVPADYEPEM
jgi:hypothetical protein